MQKRTETEECANCWRRCRALYMRLLPNYSAHFSFCLRLSAFNVVGGTGPAYFRDVLIPVSDVSGRSNLRSAERRSFRVAAPSGAVFPRTCALRPSVVNSSGLDRKLILLAKLRNNVVEECTD